MLRIPSPGERWWPIALLLSIVLLGSLTLVGCGSSAEATGEQTMPEQKSPELLALEQEVATLRTENTTLRQRLLKLEQDNQNLTARLSDTESKLMAERDRADRAADAARAAARSVTEPPRMPANAMAAYEEALQAFNARKYDEAIMRLEAILNGGVSDDLADNCHYWIGESHFGKRQYQEAIKHFEMVMNYRGSEKMADAYFMIAQAHERLGNKARAKEAYERVVKDFPTSPKVPVARQRAAKL